LINNEESEKGKENAQPFKGIASRGLFIPVMLDFFFSFAQYGHNIWINIKYLIFTYIIE